MLVWRWQSLVSVSWSYRTTTKVRVGSLLSSVCPGCQQYRAWTWIWKRVSHWGHGGALTLVAGPLVMLVFNLTLICYKFIFPQTTCIYLTNYGIQKSSEFDCKVIRTMFSVGYGTKLIKGNSKPISKLQLSSDFTVGAQLLKSSWEY